MSRAGLRTGARLLAPALAALLVASCNSSNPETTGSINPNATAASAQPNISAKLKKATEYWGSQYQSNPGDKKAGMNYARNLRAMNMSNQAVAVLAQLSAQHTSDREILAEYGKALAETGAHAQAVHVLQQAHDPKKPDWRLYSAQGVALDQMGKHKEAQEKYRAGLRIKTDEPALLNNLGLSLALSKDLKRAEQALRKAIAQPGAEPQVKQNLALVLGLQGKYDEASKIASSTLSEQQVQGNMAYLKQMMSQRASWSELERIDTKPKPATN